MWISDKQPIIFQFKCVPWHNRWNQILVPSLLIVNIWYVLKMGFPAGSAGKESACNAGGAGWIPGSGRSPGEEIGHPLQYSRASLVAQMVKNLPVMWETLVRSLSWEDPLEEGMATHSSILGWRIPVDRGAWWVTVCKFTESWTWLSSWARTYT